MYLMFLFCISQLRLNRFIWHHGSSEQALLENIKEDEHDFVILFRAIFLLYCENVITAPTYDED